MIALSKIHTSKGKKKMNTKKFLSTALASIISIGSLLGSVQGTASAESYGYRRTPDYTLEDYDSNPFGITVFTGNTTGLFQRAYIRTKNADGSTHFKVLATTNNAKIRLYYDEKYSKYYLTSTSTVVEVYEYDTSYDQHFKKAKDNRIEFKPGSGVTVGGWNNCVYLNGDVNFDHQINVTDVSKVAAHIKNIKPLSTEAQRFANVSHETNPNVGGPNNSIDVSDLILLSAYVKGENVRL